MNYITPDRNFEPWEATLEVSPIRELIMDLHGHVDDMSNRMRLVYSREPGAAEIIRELPISLTALRRAAGDLADEDASQPCHVVRAVTEVRALAAKLASVDPRMTGTADLFEYNLDLILEKLVSAKLTNDPSRPLPASLDNHTAAATARRGGRTA